MASNGKEAEFHEGVKNNASIANATPTLIVTKNADGTYEHATVANIPLSSAAIAALALKAPINNPTFTDNLSLEANALNASNNRITQIMATNDTWAIFGTATAVNKGILVFEVGDDNDPFDNSGQKFEFRYNNPSVPAGNKVAVKIDYAETTVDGNLTLTSLNSESDINTIKMLDFVGSTIRPLAVNTDGRIVVDPAAPKVYNALLNQSALGAPVPTVISNTLGGLPAWAYVSPGQYTLTLANAFPLGKTLIFALIGSGTAAGDTSIKCFRNSNSEIVLNTTFNAAFTNILLTNASFKIEVYP
jgi:hypothetical protein